MKTTTFSKGITAFLAAVVLSLIIIQGFSQTVNRWHQDGKIYFKLKDNVENNIPSENGNVKLDNVTFLSPYKSKYNISVIRKPFYNADDDKLQRTFLVQFDNIYMIEEMIKQLEQEPFIEYAEPAPIFRISLSPNDNYYVNNQLNYWLLGDANARWHLDVIHASQAWDISTGDTSVVVAIIDNAIWKDHPDLVNKIKVAIDLANDDNDPNPPQATYIWSHGTHAAGLIGAESNNSIGVASIGFDISIMAIKVGDDASDGQGMTAAFEAIVWAADNGADVISMSWGAPQYFQTMQNTINYAYNKGCVMLAAAGNNGDGMETQINPDLPVNYIGYPAACEHVIAVASTNSDDTKASSSEYGTWIDVCSPGGWDNPGMLGLGSFQVLSTTYTDAGDINSQLNGTGGGAATYGVTGKYDCMMGTSMACPVAAGLAGLMLSVNPNLTPDELTEIMKATCDNIDAQNAQFVDSIGAGRINAYTALQAILDSMTGSTITADFIASDISIMPGGTVDFTDLSTGTPISWSWTFEGGEPQTSTEQNPAGIQYASEGFFTVTLHASDSINTDIEVKTAFIIVGSFDMPESAWERQASGFESQYRGILDISITDPLTAWALAYDGTSGSMTRDFTRTTNGGLTWTPGFITAPAELAPSNICAISPAKAWVALYNTNGGGAIYATTDSGQAWVHQTSASFSNSASFPNVVHFFNENDGYCMGDPVSGEFEMYSTTDGGNNWVPVPNANIPNAQTDEMGWTDVYDVVGDILWFGTNKGRVLKSDDKGLTWTVYTTGEANVSNISMNDSQHGVMMGAVYNQQTGQMESWSMRYTTDGGATWQLINNNMDNSKSDVDAIPGIPGMVVAAKISQTIAVNASYYSFDYGMSWTMLDDSIQYTTVNFLNDTVGWAGSFNLSEAFDGVYKWLGVPPTQPYFVTAPVTSAIEFSPYSYFAVAEDPNDLPLTMGYDTLPSWLSFTDNGNDTASITGTPQTIDIGVHNVIIYATNGTDTAFQSFTISVITSDIAPEFTSTPGTMAYIGAIYTYDITTFDPDGDSLIITAPVKPSWLFFTDNCDNTALLTGIPTQPATQPQGYPVTLNVTDGTLSAQQSFYVKVPMTNPFLAPVFTSSPDTIAIYGELYNYSITASDDDDDTVTFTSASLPAWLTLTDNGDNTAFLSGTPVVSDISYYLTLTIDDGMFPVVNQQFTLHVDIPPVFTSIPDTIAMIDELYAYNITATDGDNDSLQFSASVVPLWLTFTDNNDNTALLTGTPSQQDTSELGYSIILSVTDGLIEVEQQFTIYTIINSISEINNDELHLYPNPVHDWLGLEFSGNNTLNIYIKILDVAGRTVYEISERKNSNLFCKTLNMKNYQPGVYFIEICTEKTVIISKFVKD
ncbi:MAG: S8 family serine peptidase [Bacteroidia bacterium]|nr:S8 family serine peptidase [Bacteroidia bacterium]